MFLLVLTYSSQSSSAYLCANLQGIPALQGHGWISAQCCQSPEFICSQACQLVISDITRKKKHQKKTQLMLFSYIKVLDLSRG